MPETAAAEHPNQQDILLRYDADGIATLTLNRPAQYNALSAAMLTRLQETLEAIATDERVRVVVLAGAGRAFCAGHDLREMRSTVSTRLRSGRSHQFHRACSLPARCTSKSRSKRRP